MEADLVFKLYEKSSMISILLPLARPALNDCFGVCHDLQHLAAFLYLRVELVMGPQRSRYHSPPSWRYSSTYRCYEAQVCGVL